MMICYEILDPECLYHVRTFTCPPSVTILEEGMENWTQDKLEEVVKKKHEEAEKKKPKTDIVRCCFIFFKKWDNLLLIVICCSFPGILYSSLPTLQRALNALLYLARTFLVSENQMICWLSNVLHLPFAISSPKY